MKNQTKNLALAAHMTALISLSVLAYADEPVPSNNDLPDVETLSEAESNLKFKTITEYDTRFFPGVRLCEESEVDYRNGARKVNCQDEKLIRAVSTRNVNQLNERPNTILNERVQPNGNILRINFGRILVPNSNTTDN